MCEVLGVSRDAYYKRATRGEREAESIEGVLEVAREIRRDEPRTGTRKLHDRLDRWGQTIGRDRLFDVLRERRMLVKPKKKFQRTTYSRHRYSVAPNRLKSMVVERPNQALVCDITYLTLNRGFAYLFLVTDVYSRKIVGYHLSRDLSHYSACSALQRAIRGLRDTTGIVCHSDRGCQYCCHEYLALLAEHSMVSSMTDESHCYQNAIAERVNGILKDEFSIDAVFSTFADALGDVHKAISVYNGKRTHWSLGLRTPAEVYGRAA